MAIDGFWSFSLLKEVVDITFNLAIGGGLHRDVKP
jgi:hypothetical protein